VVLEMILWLWWKIGNWLGVSIHS